MRAIVLLVVFLSSSLPAIELYSTTAEIISDSPHVAYVIVESSQIVNGVQEFDLVVLEDFKGQLPERIRIRVPRLAELGNLTRLDPPGTEFIIMVGNASGGLYPLRSITWGRIQVFVDDAGEKRLARNLTGLGGGQFQGKSFTLRDFRDVMRNRTK